MMEHHPLRGCDPAIRNSYDALMARFPAAHSLQIDLQEPLETILISDPIHYDIEGPWICIDFTELRRRYRFAIFKHTADVYRCTPWGEIDDDEGTFITGFRQH